MSTSVLNAAHFASEEAAYGWVESRLWPEGPVCPHCGGFERISKMQGKATRLGLYKCYQCRKQFRVTVGTIFEASHVPLNLWLQAMYLMASSKKGISSNQLHRTLGVTLKTAWFMSHRIREAMTSGDLGPLGGEGMTVEADETYFGQKEGPVRPSEQRKDRPYTKGGKSGPAHKRAVVSLVQRGGKVRSFHPEKATKEAVVGIVKDNIAAESRFMTDESRLYHGLSAHFGSHLTVKHSHGEYVRGDAYTNTVEGYFSIFKRGMKGIYQHCAEKHLHRYLAEFDFRYNNRVILGVNDRDRADNILRGVVGKRLTYRTVGGGL
ncbi:IS1595 family transposase [Methylobacterium sp. J-067]|uniref:IS1595 family transposase n=1 Tax=Methylobacterium sp. J-067 TaxID=2836648 RepID=UPI001FBACDC0|nr:IS1595 family transposase [Methylobacterium sp. J-067]MCJ2024398.1 IS1595 family transposase [Methylobacterium sp. J-067]